MLRVRTAFVIALLTVVVSLSARAQVVESKSESMIVPVNKSRVIKLAVDVRDVLVTNPDIADVVVRRPTQIYLLARQIGTTNVFLFDGTGNVLRRIEVRVQLDVAPVEAALAVSLPNERILVSAANQTLFLNGTVATAVASENARQIARQFVSADGNVVNLIKVRGDQQVLLRVRVAEMTRQIAKEFGLRSTTTSFPLGEGTLSVVSGIARANQFATSTFSAATFGPFDQLTLVLEALERNGLVKILAEPNLTAVSGQSASFLAGGEFPIPIPGSDGSVTIEFREFGIRLSFTPAVLSPSLISLQVETEVSALTDQGSVTLGGFTIPGLTTRRASTTVEVPSGASIVIAGLLQNDVRNTVQGFPGLKDIPILGALFHSTQFQADQSEVIITVTPILVRPVDPQDLALPTDGFGPGSDIDLLLLGRLHAVHSKPPLTPGGPRLRGPVGFRAPRKMPR